MMTASMHLNLASASPRRRELLEKLGLDYTLVPHEVDETRLQEEGPGAYVRRLAEAKARAGVVSTPGESAGPVIGADTVVVCDGQLLGKPNDRRQALEILSLLSGNTHRVLTAVAVADADRAEVALSTTEVDFRPLTESEMLAYWKTGEPRDKAGAYAIQGLGGMFVKRLEGSYSGVMGLPVFETVQLLADFGLSCRRIMQGYRP